MRKSYISMALTMVVTLATTTAFTQERRLTTLANVTRNGQSETRVIYDIWSAEYPSPVIDVNSRDKKGTTTVKAHRFLQDLSNPVNCEIKNGLYHPWSQTARSAKGYYTVTKHDMYRVNMKNNVLDTKVQISEGSLISEVVYLSEGFCSGVVLSNDGKNGKTQTKLIDSFDCQTLIDNPIFTSISSDKEIATEQYVQLKCADGSTAFALDEEMLAAEGVKQGTITGYGSIGPAPRK
jgi:hypothetical protein